MTRMTIKKKKILRMYELLQGHFGDLGWWPAVSAFEVIVGAVLTQNTAWSNVEKAISALKSRGLMDPLKIKRENKRSLSMTIRSSGYHNIKADRLKKVSEFVLNECGGDIKKLAEQNGEKLRKKFLGVKGIGPETADSILVYALNKPVFVVDAYTKRIFGRHGLAGEGASYDDIQRAVHADFPGSVKEMNQFHALLVETAKTYCRKRTVLCGECPLSPLLEKNPRAGRDVK